MTIVLPDPWDVLHSFEHTQNNPIALNLREIITYVCSSCLLMIDT
jgi:hypothetical protein